MPPDSFLHERSDFKTLRDRCPSLMLRDCPILGVIREQGDGLDLRPISHSVFNLPEYPCFDAESVRHLCVS